MAVSFTGRVVNSVNLGLLNIAISGSNEGLYHQVCKGVLDSFRRSIEDSGEYSKYEPFPLFVSQSVGESGNFYAPPGCISGVKRLEEGIYLDFRSAVIDSKKLDSTDLLLGSLGHELGHFYVRRLSDFYRVNIHPMWNEFIADFMGGLLFGLDQDNDPKTWDLNVEGRRHYFPYRCEEYYRYEKIPGSKYGYYENERSLDGVHPFCAARVAAIEMGFPKGCGLKNYPLP
ncbi:MAG: hypothetical protein IJY04_11115, partial [Clostridia bacterium]|nr:hypothetical protein [Clostridia bacterium]